MKRSSAAVMLVAAMLLVQLGAAASLSLFDRLGPAATAWIRLCWASLILVVAVRPRLRGLPRRDLGTVAALGAVSGGMVLMFFEGIARLPLGTTVAIEFCGPLTVAVLRRSGRGGLVWPALALMGVLALTRPWTGELDPVGLVFAAGAGTGWALYILLTARVADRFSGSTGLALATPFAALVLTPIGLPQAIAHHPQWSTIAGAGVVAGILVVPFVLEMYAIRRLTVAAFGVLMCLEPAVALLVGSVGLGQVPQPAQIAGIALVVAAGIGAERTGHRPPASSQRDSEAVRAEAAPRDEDRQREQDHVHRGELPLATA
jgi:inner membrane transporter RhtA